MKNILFFVGRRVAVAALSAFLVNLAVARGGVVAGKYNLAEVRDASTLETRVIEDWKPSVKDPAVRQKLVEITIGEWWPGQKVRLPVTFNAPASGGPCRNLIINNTGLQLKPAMPTGAMLRLLKEHGVGVVLIGMNTIDSMEPVGKLDVGMKEHFLKTKDARYTPAWIWGLSDMRALTAALAEKDVFQPRKVLATGGSKRGVATAAAGTFDDRFTAILPVVAPIMDSPGGPYVEGMMPEKITRMNEQFLADIKAGKFKNIPVAAHDALVYRQKVRADERITVAEARAAGWTDAEMKAASELAWEVSRITNYLPGLRKRGLEIFYNQGANDNVSPGLLKLGRQFPDFPIYVVPGGQHGAAKETGLTKSVGSLPEVDENLFAFAQHHFFSARPMVATPKVTRRWDKTARRLQVTVAFPDKSQPQQNELWWVVDHNPDYSIAMEYDAWQSTPLRETAPGAYTGEITLAGDAATLDFVTVHRHTHAGSTLTVSGPLLRVETR